MQLVTTFISGLFFAVSYRYTKNIWLLVIFHGLWDYILFSGIGKAYSAVNIMMGVLFVVELIITFVLVRKYKKELNNI